ncbi:MAG: hypothetical protein IJE00_09285, partial [Clostridia bacterium]|nr:hypothetical protein [Clostridia bacterium]
MKKIFSVCLCLILMIGCLSIAKLPLKIAAQTAEIYWSDDFEDGLGDWEKIRDGSSVWTDTAPYSYISLTEKAYEGSQSFG